MLKEFLEHILKIQNPEIMPVDGRNYSTKPLSPVLEPMASTVKVATLTGLVDYLKSGVDVVSPLDDMLLHVEDHATVHLLSAVTGQFRQREVLMTAKADLLQMQFNAWIDSERFNIFMQACFLDDGDRAAILKVVGNISEGTVRNTDDDGVSQEVTIKTGIARVGAAKVPNPVTLRPYRTFNEVEQPSSQFVFRMKEGPACMLVEADGGAWRNKARKNIKAFLEFELADTGIKIIA